MAFWSLKNSVIWFLGKRQTSESCKRTWARYLSHSSCRSSTLLIPSERNIFWLRRSSRWNMEHEGSLLSRCRTHALALCAEPSPSSYTASGSSYQRNHWSFRVQLVDFWHAPSHSMRRSYLSKFSQWRLPWWSQRTDEKAHSNRVYPEMSHRGIVSHSPHRMRPPLNPQRAEKGDRKNPMMGSFWKDTSERNRLYRWYLSWRRTCGCSLRHRDAQTSFLWGLSFCQSSQED